MNPQVTQDVSAHLRKFNVGGSYIMANANMEMKIVVNSKTATKQIEKATKAAEKLKAELDKLQQIEIGINVVEVKKRWWKFWE